MHNVNPKKKAPAVVLLMTMTMLGVFCLDVLLPSFPALARHFRTTPEDIAFYLVRLAAYRIAGNDAVAPLLTVIVGPVLRRRASEKRRKNSPKDTFSDCDSGSSYWNGPSRMEFCFTLNGRPARIPGSQRGRVCSQESALTMSHG